MVRIFKQTTYVGRFGTKIIVLRHVNASNFDFREQLIKVDDNETVKKYGSSMTNMSIENLNIKSLADSGRQVYCIIGKYLLNDNFRACLIKECC